MIKQKKIFSSNECQDIINNTEKVEEFYWKKEDRRYTSYQIYKSEKTKWIFEKIKYFFEKETSHTILNNLEKIHFHKFILGDFFKPHNDLRDKRIYSVGVILNDDFNGGDFNLYETSRTVIKKQSGNAYLFDVGITHEITEVTSGVRFSLILFLNDNNLEKVKNKLL